ncbi:uncharacterized protein EAF01_010930 [Botrytis porri]|uniref:uncharacterized protein n=1 Tax=Botrytis porri TaxID=87229 RepID=UPI0019025263|nr:uncharacterized protein EAF01_010930 [Botrytis porri]KAF7889437.1 hypothetical protein EAF01_010930 [Botrytis porri]
MGVLMERMAEASANEPRAGMVFSIVLSMISMAVLAICMTRRVQNVQDWSRYPLVCWLVLWIYFDSLVFVLGSAVVSAGFGVNYSQYMCSNAIILCLSCYMTTKVSIELRELDLISGSMFSSLQTTATFTKTKSSSTIFSLRELSSKSRIKDPLYLFNSIGMLIPYCIVIALNFVFRFANYENGECRIGMKQVAMIPLIAFDILVNVYLTSLFLVPLQGLYSYKNNPNSQTRTVALRTFIGSCCALTSSAVNLTLLLVLKGEPGWICLMCCNLDILFSVLVLHWITSKDNASTFLPRRSHSHTHSHTCSSYPTIRTSALSSPISPRPLISSPRSIPENMGFPNRDHLFMSTNGMNGGNPDDYRYARDAIDLPTVTTTVTAGVGVGVVETIDGEEEGKNRGLGNGNAEMGIRKPKMAIVVERDHVREVVETGIRIVNDRDHDRLILTLPRSISGGGGSIGIEIREREKEKGAGKIGEEDDMDISF